MFSFLFFLSLSLRNYSSYFLRSFLGPDPLLETKGSTRFPKATGNASRRGRGGERWSLAVRIQGNWILALDTATRWRGRSSNASDLYRRDGSRCSVSTKPDRDLEMIEMSASSILLDFRPRTLSLFDLTRSYRYFLRSIFILHRGTKFSTKFSIFLKI